MNKINCLNLGFVELVDTMPQEIGNGDLAILEFARVTYESNRGKKYSENENEGLIRYLMRHAHHTPLEAVDFKFHCKAPIFVARQWFRHRICSYNEVSGRYSQMKDEFWESNSDVDSELYNPLRLQSQTNKQGGSEIADDDLQSSFDEDSTEYNNKVYFLYKYYLDQGISKEQARTMLPLSLYTEWYWKINLRSLLNFLNLRCDSHAQFEIRTYADAILKLITPYVPITIKAWEEYSPYRGGILLSKLELDALRKTMIKMMIDPKSSPEPINSSNKREQAEWIEKIKRLFG